MKRRTRIADARKLCDEVGARAVVVIALDREDFSVTSYGETRAECRSIAKLVDRLHHQITTGALPVWET